jgi:hypothetical protein
MKPVSKGNLNSAVLNKVKPVPVARVGVKPAPKITQSAPKMIQKSQVPKNTSGSSGGCLCGR